MKPPTEHRYDDRQTLAATLADSLAADLRTAITDRGHGSLVVSGGSTPKPLFAALGAQDLPWDKVFVTLADERWVTPEHPDANENLVHQHLLKGNAQNARWIGLKTPAPTPAAGQAACEQFLMAIPRPFDLVVLGMGSDGHTASLFPNARELPAGLDPTNPATCLAVEPPDAPHSRMSLTLRALLDSRRVILHITGENKWQVYQRALLNGPVDELPIRAVLRHGARVEVWWSR